MLYSPFTKINGKVYWIRNGTFVIVDNQIAVLSPHISMQPIPFLNNEQTYEEKHILDSHR